MTKYFYLVGMLVSALLLSACSTPIIKLQHVTQPQAKLAAFGDVDVQVFTDNRPAALREPEDRITYQEVLKSDNLMSEFLQTSQGVGSSTWYYATDPQVSVFLHNIMQQVGVQSGFSNSHATKHYVLQGVIHNLSLKWTQTQGVVVVNVKFTGILRKKNGVMLMIIPIDFNYTQAMTKPLADKEQTMLLNALMDQALTASVEQMYKMIWINFPAPAPSPALRAKRPLPRRGEVKKPVSKL
ncbi:MAG: hypothetical protein Q7V63_07260 [Gammaproteobacteria bacterium]|nr:hypothetical protein [Gammaproteobacteria bacterium]